MQRTPVIFLLFLISLVIISAFVGADDNGNYPWEQRGNDPMSVNPLGPVSEQDDRPPAPLFPQRTQILTDETAFLGDNIEKSESMAKRLDMTVNRLKAEGNDVVKLEGLVEDYSLLVDDSKMYFEKANSTGSSSESASQEQEYLEKSKESSIQANLMLKDIFHELKPYLAIHAKIPDNGTLSAEGTGTVVLSGDFDVEMSFSNGKLSYVDFRQDVSVEMDDDTKPETVRTADMKEELVSYENVTGNINLSGSGFIMELTGENISLIASGTGEAELFGDGTYSIGDDNVSEGRRIWIPPLFENN